MVTSGDSPQSILLSRPHWPNSKVASISAEARTSASDALDVHSTYASISANPIIKRTVCKSGPKPPPPPCKPWPQVMGGHVHSHLVRIAPRSNEPTRQSPSVSSMQILPTSSQVSPQRPRTAQRSSTPMKPSPFMSQGQGPNGERRKARSPERKALPTIQPLSLTSWASSRSSQPTPHGLTSAGSFRSRSVTTHPFGTSGVELSHKRATLATVSTPTTWMRPLLSALLIPRALVSLVAGRPGSTAS